MKGKSDVGISYVSTTKSLKNLSTHHMLKNILGTSSNWIPNRLQAGSDTRWDINNAQQNVSSLCLFNINKYMEIFDLQYNLMWHREILQKSGLSN